MAKIEIIQHKLWYYLDDFLNDTVSRRASLRYKTDLRIGTNATIIFLAACTLEGALEDFLKDYLESRNATYFKDTPTDFHARRTLCFFLSNVIEDINARIQRSTGAENYEGIFHLLSNRKHPIKFSSFKHWEGIRVLFQLRNVIAHGREVRAEIQTDYWPKSGVNEVFQGGYKLAENYLIKNKLLKHKFIQTGSVRHLFTNPIADHFVKISKNFILFLDKAIESELEPMTMASVDRFDP